MSIDSFDYIMLFSIRNYGIEKTDISQNIMISISKQGIRKWEERIQIVKLEWNFDP